MRAGQRIHEGRAHEASIYKVSSWRDATEDYGRSKLGNAFRERRLAVAATTRSLEHGQHAAPDGERLIARPRPAREQIHTDRRYVCAKKRSDTLAYPQCGSSCPWQ